MIEFSVQIQFGDIKKKMSSPLTKVTFYQLVPGLQAVCSELEKQARVAVVHKCKFQLSCIQFRQFVNQFSITASDLEECVNVNQIGAYKYIIQAVREYIRLFYQHDTNNWINSVISNNCSYVASDLCGLATHLRECAAYLDKEASNIFDATSNKWLQCQILDLKEIKYSLSQYKSSSTSSDIVKSRTNSIDAFLNEYSSSFKPDEVEKVENNSPIPIYYQDKIIKQEDLEFIKEVGSGATCVVYYGIYHLTKAEVAIKKLKFQKLTKKTLKNYQDELSVLITANHPCLLRFIGATDVPPYIIATDWMPGNSLYDDLHKHHKLDKTKLTIAAFDIARGMRFLHKRNIIHRDLKSLNVLLDQNGYAKVCDFGLSTYAGKGQFLTKSLGTPYWMAPELLSTDTAYDNKVDVYAYAIVLWEIVTTKSPYQGISPAQIIAQVLANDKRPPVPTNCNDEFKDLIQKCWARDPETRPSFNQVIKLFSERDILINGADADEVREYITNAMKKPEEQGYSDD